jgi:uncharacterized protein
MRILLTGASGFIGSSLGMELSRQGHELIVLTRARSTTVQGWPFPCQVVTGDLNQGPVDFSSAGIVPSGLDAVFHLAGENVGEGRWSAQKKENILNSRVRVTENLIQSLQNIKVRTFISASAVGIYGHRDNEVLTEASSSGAADDFLVQVTEAWEKSLQKIKAERQVIFRFGVVLSPWGGALSEIVSLFARGVGAVLGSGKQWMPWIALEDVIGSLVHALKNQQVQGTYNLVAPTPVQNSEFTKILAEKMQTFTLPQVPSLVLKLSLGQKAQLVLTSQKVSAEKWLKTGYRFKFSEIAPLLDELSALSAQGRKSFRSFQFFKDLSPEQIFPFFSDARNLGKITPESLQFKIQKIEPEPLQTGSVIDYKLKIHGVPVRWQSRIENWQPPSTFSDSQIKGPYKSWLHTHSFEKVPGGTLMKDQVTYQLPLGRLGSAVAGAFVASDVKNIFRHRTEVLRHIKDFGEIE